MFVESHSPLSQIDLILAKMIPIKGNIYIVFSYICISCLRSICIYTSFFFIFNSNFLICCDALRCNSAHCVKQKCLSVLAVTNLQH